MQKELLRAIYLACLSTSSADTSIGVVILSGTLWFIATWRLVHNGCYSASSQHHDSINQREHYYHHQYHVVIIMRRGFHVLLWLDLMFQTLSYGCSHIYGSNSTTNSPYFYLCLQLAGRNVFEFLAFSLVTIAWFRAVAMARAGVSETNKKTFLFVPVLLLFAWTIVFLLSFIEAMLLFLKTTSTSAHQYYFVFGIASAWALHGILIFIGGVMLYRRLSGIPMWGRLTTWHKLTVFTRVYCCMFFCAICYLIRGIVLFLPGNTISYGNYRQHQLLWLWLPTTLVPSVLLLFSSRNRAGNLISSRNSVSFDEPTIIVPESPGRIFIDFQRAICDNCDQSLARSFDFFNTTTQDESPLFDRLLSLDNSFVDDSSIENCGGFYDGRADVPWEDNSCLS
mmetsp:Transcript_8715/g.12702  ORF Transcript_8715/g.12702 Transcript_8715/m.12702 type:complete len:395 (+) Transcript_8715:45-1229(+)